MKNLTPPSMKCAMTISCPSIHELDDGSLLIVGEILGPVGAEKLGLPATKVNWRTEGVLRIDRALLANVDPFPSNAS